METSSPIVPAGRVTVKPAEVVLQKYPSPATAVGSAVITACQAVPPDIVVHDKTPEALDVKASPDVPASARGKV